MENIRIVLDSSEVEHIVIEREDGSFLSMPKSTYDEQQAALSTPMVSDEAPSI
jgi:hypothetical protein